MKQIYKAMRLLLILFKTLLFDRFICKNKTKYEILALLSTKTQKDLPSPF